MGNTKSYDLYFGPYRTPTFKYGAVVQDEVRDAMTIIGMTDARIPWPVGVVGSRRGPRASAIIYGDLARALRVESPSAVGYWWGLSSSVVKKFRRWLEVERGNPGTLKLREQYGQDPKRRAKIAAARTGKARPRHVVEALLASHLGKPTSEETRQKMSLTHKKRGTRPPKAGRPWTKKEDALLLKYSRAEVVKRTGRTLSAVQSRREELGLPDRRRRGIPEK